MLNFYPGNRMEDLVTLLSRLLEIPSITAPAKASVLAEDVIVVQNQGMHHWLSLELAQRRGVIMNTRFPLPGHFFWNIIKTLLGDEAIPDASPYSREILVWAVYQSLGEESFLNDSDCEEPKKYWFDLQTGKVDALKRFQLAREMSDLFEQYLIYRPEWIKQWDQSINIVSIPLDSKSVQWQAKLWNSVKQRLGEPPLNLIDKAIARLSQNASKLPPRIFAFGINALAPIWMDFLKAVSEHTEVHLFMLNPSDEYWGDLRTEKSQYRARAKWLNEGRLVSALCDDIGNPLLANLGQQGQECLKLICERSDTEIPLFYSSGRDTLLHCIQDDILSLTDRRDAPEEHSYDESVTMVSSHSALREVQVLHDWLLMQFKNDSTLNPKDVLVMSPQVENYAPYIDSVFRRGWFKDNSESTQLPCSIADRKLNDSEPLIQAFSELLQLPDSRFQVSQILAYLRLSAVQKRFDLDNKDIDEYVHWLSVSSVHWGLDAAHKTTLSELGTEVNNHFTWQQGLERLLLGFAQGDEECIYTDYTGKDQLVLPWIEGQQGIKLGRLIRLIENLAYYSVDLNRDRTPSQWQVLLMSLIENLFDADSEDLHGYQLIVSVIDTLIENTALADFNTKIPLSVVSAYLNNCFNQPEQGQSFMTGQVTFCSMIPMRSVPFKIIAILGLNDGQFPRQRQALGFDLLAESPPKLGDRSRRGDDRYLFLEALISAREKLYLSYQGNDVKTNQDKQPSLLVTELVDYLSGAYGWKLDAELKKYPLQAFSEENYIAPRYSFDGRWLAIAQAAKEGSPNQIKRSECVLPPPVIIDDISNGKETLKLEQLISFFDNPARSFARDRLKLNLSFGKLDIPEDAEPFSSNHLDRYLMQSDLIQCQLNAGDTEQLLYKETLRGHLPNSPRTQLELRDWKQQSELFYEALSGLAIEGIEYKEVSINIGDYQLITTLPMSGHSSIFWRLADPKGKDMVRQWLNHLVASEHYKNDPSFDFKLTQGVYRDQKNDGFKILQFDTIAEPAEELKKWLTYREQGLLSPLFLNAELAKKLFEKTRVNKEFTSSDFNKLWCDSFTERGLSYDPYMKWFWDDAPDWPGTLKTTIEDLYCTLFNSVQELEQ